jgi:hypothetical protein
LAGRIGSLRIEQEKKKRKRKEKKKANRPLQCRYMVDILIASAYIKHNFVSLHPPSQVLLYSATVCMAQCSDRYPNGSALCFIS